MHNYYKDGYYDTMKEWKPRALSAEAGLAEAKNQREGLSLCNDLGDALNDKLVVENTKLREALGKILAVESPWLGHCPDCFERFKQIAQDALKGGE